MSQGTDDGYCSRQVSLWVKREEEEIFHLGEEGNAKNVEGVRRRWRKHLGE